MAGLLALLGFAVRAQPDGFTASVLPIPDQQRRKMVGVSWRPGCPVAPDELRMLRLAYWGFDRAPLVGTLVIHRQLARETVAIFHALFDARFPIARMQPYEDFAAGEYAARNDTVGFYCRPDQGDPSKFGMHSYDYAIDLNPVENPYHDAKRGWWPPGSAAGGNRDKATPGMIATGSAAFAIFTRHGWLWGGLFRGAPDYMHFEKGTVGAHPDPTRAPYSITGLTYQGQ